jgi:predicted enzyme involved in methoxymalonyl-ACP biosynthesis
MEFAMMDTLVHRCRERGVREIRGFYYPTAKNAMVKEFYKLQGFEKIREDEKGNTEWRLMIDDHYVDKNKVIQVEE